MGKQGGFSMARSKNFVERWFYHKLEETGHFFDKAHTGESVNLMT